MFICDLLCIGCLVTCRDLDVQALLAACSLVVARDDLLKPHVASLHPGSRYDLLKPRGQVVYASQVDQPDSLAHIFIRANH